MEPRCLAELGVTGLHRPTTRVSAMRLAETVRLRVRVLNFIQNLSFPSPRFVPHDAWHRSHCGANFFEDLPAFGKRGAPPGCLGFRQGPNSFLFLYRYCVEGSAMGEAVRQLRVEPGTGKRPLCVDLDGTLIRTEMLGEGALAL